MDGWSTKGKKVRYDAILKSREVLPIRFFFGGYTGRCFLFRSSVTSIAWTEVLLDFTQGQYIAQQSHRNCFGNFQVNFRGFQIFTKGLYGWLQSLKLGSIKPQIGRRTGHEPYNGKSIGHPSSPALFDGSLETLSSISPAGILLFFNYLLNCFPFRLVER